MKYISLFLLLSTILLTSMDFKNKKMYDQVTATIKDLRAEFEAIPMERKEQLQMLTDYVSQKVANDEDVNLIFICTHNSRRSHISQIWAQAAATYYGIPNVHCYSGGTEATAFNPRAIRAMQEAGFQISRTAGEDNNPVYEVTFADDQEPLIAFSKKYDDEENPKKEFAAIMTCSHADKNCPLVAGAEDRIPIPYDYPKEFDNTSQEEEKYTVRVHEIGRDMLFVFSSVNQQ